MRTHCCFVAGLLQVLWQQGEATRQGPHCPMTKGRVDSSVDDVAAAQQARARRRADGLDVVVREARAGRRPAPAPRRAGDIRRGGPRGVDRRIPLGG